MTIPGRILPVLVVGGFVVIALSAPTASQFAVGLSGILVSLIVFWRFCRFKMVRIDGDALVVSDYSSEERVPLSWIGRVDEHRHGRSMHVSIAFDRECAFGRIIEFLPQESAVAQELRLWAEFARGAALSSN